MTIGAMERCRKALEEGFFAKKNRQLLDKLRAIFARNATREGPRAATGITDPAILDLLLALELSGETVARLRSTRSSRWPGRTASSTAPSATRSSRPR